MGELGRGERQFITGEQETGIVKRRGGGEKTDERKKGTAAEGREKTEKQKRGRRVWRETLHCLADKQRVPPEPGR